ncbi:MAG: hypothetical protein JRC77_08395 [Deltaproteobacteria bacterium]|nr:hypothetical protein [Deltaproteobacteria bacterium]
MAHLTVDTSRLPVVVLDLNGNYSEAQAEQFCAEMRAVLERRKRIAIVADARKAGMSSLKARSVMRQFTTDTMHLSDAYTACTAVIINSAIVRMGVSAMFHLTKPNFPIKVFKTPEEGIEWTLQFLSMEIGAPEDARVEEGEDLFIGGAPPEA